MIRKYILAAVCTLVVAVSGFSQLAPPTETGSAANLFPDGAKVIVVGQGRVKVYHGLGGVYRLIAVPAEGSIFAGWSGDIESSESSISTRLTEDMVIEADFAPNPFYLMEGEYRGRIVVMEPLPLTSQGPIQAQVLGDGSYFVSFRIRNCHFHHSGKFTPDGQAGFTISNPGFGFVSSFDVLLQLDPNDGRTMRVQLSGFDFIGLGGAEKRPN